MTINYEIELVQLVDGEEVYDYLNVRFDGDCEWDNDGIGPYEYWGAKGYDHGHDYVRCEGITWDERRHSAEDNARIQQWLDVEANFRALEKALCLAFEEDTKNYDPY